MIMNTIEVPIVELSNTLDIWTKQWASCKMIEIITFDNYDIIVQFNFLDKIYALVILFVDCLFILDRWYQYED